MAFDLARVRAILWDLDGTLADTDDAYIQRTGQMLRPVHFLFPRRDPTNFLRWGLMLAESPLNALMGMPDWLGIDTHLTRVVEWASDRRPSKAQVGHFVLMDGVDKMLPRAAARYPQALVTARGARATRAFVEQHGLGPHFSTIVSALTAKHTKPFPHPVLWAAEALGVPAEQCVMIGDTTVDILAGRRAGAQTIGVLCGFGERAELERSGADLVVAHTLDAARALGL